MIEGVAPADARRFHLDDEARCGPVYVALKHEKKCGVEMRTTV